jgi:hypothetical protein
MSRIEPSSFKVAPNFFKSKHSEVLSNKFSPSTEKAHLFAEMVFGYALPMSGKSLKGRVHTS